MDDATFNKARDVALRFLTYRARSRKELADRLAENFDGDVVERVVALCEQYGYIDDRAFARAFVDTKRTMNGFGPFRLTHALIEKGVDKCVIDEILDESEQSDAETAAFALRKRYRNGFPITDDDSNEFFKERNRAVQYLARKGFSFEEAAMAVDRFATE